LGTHSPPDTRKNRPPAPQWKWVAGGKGEAYGKIQAGNGVIPNLIRHCSFPKIMLAQVINSNNNLFLFIISSILVAYFTVLKTMKACDTNKNYSKPESRGKLRIQRKRIKHLWES